MPLPASLIASIVSTVLETLAQNPSTTTATRATYESYVTNRTLPPEAKIGVMRPLANDGQVVIDDTSMKLSPGAQIRSPNNMIVMPMTVQENKSIVYLTDMNGAVYRIWIVSAAELDTLKKN